MARRSPLNRRYQKDAKVGSTRKSAAAAKPKRSTAGAAASSSTKGSRAKTSGRARGGSAMAQLPPEIKRLQKISFSLLGGAVALSVLYLWRSKEWGSAGPIMLGFAYALMFTALYLDFSKIRPALKAARKGQTPAVTRSGKASGSADASKESKDSKQSAQSERPGRSAGAADTEGADTSD